MVKKIELILSPVIETLRSLCLCGEYQPLDSRLQAFDDLADILFAKGA